MNKAKCTVISSLHHDGVKYAPGETAELPEDSAKKLAAAGVVKICDGGEAVKVQADAEPVPAKSGKKK